MKIFPGNKKGYVFLAAGMAALMLSAVFRPMITNAEVVDESTYDSSVQGTNEQFYRTIATNYHAGSIVGLVTRTSAADMDKAANLTDADKAKGYEPVLFVDDFDWNNEDRKTADKVAQQMNGTLVAMLDIQLFRYEVVSYAPVHDAGAVVTMIAGIPEKSHKNGNEYTVIKDDGREFAMIRVHNGEVTVLKDQDNDPKTITFQTDKFSGYGLMYAPAGEIDKYLGSSTSSQNTPATTPSQGTEQPAQSGQTSGTDKAELDDVPKTGDILWEIEYGYVK